MQTEERGRVLSARAALCHAGLRGSKGPHPRELRAKPAASVAALRHGGGKFAHCAANLLRGVRTLKLSLRCR